MTKRKLKQWMVFSVISAAMVQSAIADEIGNRPGNSNDGSSSAEAIATEESLWQELLEAFDVDAE